MRKEDICGYDIMLCPDKITFRCPKIKSQKPSYSEWMVYHPPLCLKIRDGNRFL